MSEDDDGDNAGWAANTGNIMAPVYGGGYQYQGMGSDIMDALSNVFTPSSAEGFNIEDFAAGNLDAQIENYLASQDMLYSGSLNPTYGFAPGDSIWEDQLFQTTGTQAINPNIGATALGFTNIFDSDSLAATLSQLGGLEGEAALSGSEVRALTPGMIDKTTQAYYSPYEEVKRDALVGKLHERRGEAQTGGFAGSGQRQSGLSEAERLYRSGYGDILSDIEN